MKYDFTSILDRHGKDAIAIDGLGTMPGFAPAGFFTNFTAVKSTGTPEPFFAFE